MFMKNPLRFQTTEYDCATTTIINALSYLYEREELPIELVKAVYEYTLDEMDQEGILGKGGTSKKGIGGSARPISEYDKRSC